MCLNAVLLNCAICTVIGRAVGSCQFRLSYCRMLSLKVGSPFLDYRLLLYYCTIFALHVGDRALNELYLRVRKESEYALCLNAVLLNCAICTVRCPKDGGRIVGLAYSLRSRFMFWSDISVVGRGIYRGTANSSGRVNGVDKIISDGQ